MNNDIRVEARGLTDILHRAYNETNKSMTSLLKQAAIFCGMSARKDTPQSVINVPVKPLNRDERAAHGGYKFMFEKWIQNKPVSFFSNTRMDPRRKVRKRGAAKGAWSGVLKKLGGAAVIPNSVYLASQNASIMETFDSDSMAAGIIVIGTAISYSEKIAPGLAESSAKKAENRMRGFLDNLAKKQAEKIGGR